MIWGCEFHYSVPLTLFGHFSNTHYCSCATLNRGKTLQTIALVYTLLTNHIELDAFEEYHLFENGNVDNHTNTNSNKSKGTGTSNMKSENDDDDVFMNDTKRSKKKALRMCHLLIKIPMLLLKAIM